MSQCMQFCAPPSCIQGTTVDRLRQKLEVNEGKQVVSWSNGNIFRSVTYLAAT
jgi:hypothetical protein